MRLFVGLFTISIAFAAQAQTVVFTEDFQSGIPATWTVVDNDGHTPAGPVSEYTEGWISKEDPDSTGNFTASSTSYFEPAAQADRWLISPELTLSSFGNIINWKGKSHDASFPDSYEVRISTTGTELVDFTDTVEIVYGENDLWESRSVNLSDSGYNDQTVHIAFRIFSADGFKIYIDDFEQVINDPASVNDLNASNIKVNQTANGVFTIDNFKTISSVQAVDIQGRELTDLNSELNVIEVKEKGLIVLIVRADGFVYRKKFWII